MSNVQIFGGFVLHIGSFSGKTGRLYIGDKVVCKVILYLFDRSNTHKSGAFLLSL